jgi:hypothetical protein
MKGERIMNRIRLLLCTLLVASLTAFSSGIGVSYAEQGPAAAGPPAGTDAGAARLTPEQKAAVAKRKEDSAARALAKRAEMLKQRKAGREYIKKVVEGQQPGAEAPAPVDAGTGGAK